MIRPLEGDVSDVTMLRQGFIWFRTHFTNVVLGQITPTYLIDYTSAWRVLCLHTYGKLTPYSYLLYYISQRAFKNAFDT